MFKKIISGKIWVLAMLLGLSGCREIALYEQLVNVPGGEWKRERKLNFGIEIADTSVHYNLYATIRHTTLYPYRNIWIRVGLQQPGSDSVTYQDFELPLASNDAWLGTGMNDVYERRVRLFGTPIKFENPGRLNFSLQHIMREDPLPAVLQVGLRVEPVP